MAVVKIRISRRIRIILRKLCFLYSLTKKILSSTNFTTHADKAFLVLEVNPEIALGWME